MARKARKKAPKAQTRLIGYVRVSTEEQAWEGVSLASQRARLKAYATAHDAKLVGIEVGVKASLEARLPVSAQGSRVRWPASTRVKPIGFSS
jgi:hypothetical protein